MVSILLVATLASNAPTQRINALTDQAHPVLVPNRAISITNHGVKYIVIAAQSAVTGMRALTSQPISQD
jgi:hypothetical protein